ncbi:HIT family protein [Streptomyces sindenensis]|uniref:HIT family protein n=1 Tax=Streptomyces sindenensis TaxID=67363 RepID=A0ABW6ERR0_9ACTN
MTPRLTRKRRAALLRAAAHPRGNIDPRTVSKADEIALETLGFADSIDDCGHVQGAPDPEGEHRGHPHLFRITTAGRNEIAADTATPCATPDKGRSAPAAAGGGPDTMTQPTTPDPLDVRREIDRLQRESDRLLIATAARSAFEDLVDQHDAMQRQGDNSPEADAVREEAAEYLSGRRPVPPPVRPGELITHARDRVAVLARLAEAGVEEAALGIAEAEAELAKELHKVRADCAFCAIAAGTAPASVVRDWGDVLAIRPRGGVAEGHLLVIPRRHVEDAGTDPKLSGRVMECAAEFMAEHVNANIITSKGDAATQTVYHLHMHLLPRTADDELPLPWTPQQEAARRTEGNR